MHFVDKILKFKASFDEFLSVMFSLYNVGNVIFILLDITEVLHTH